MQFLSNLFSESGSVSMTRLMSFIVVMTACYLAITKGPEELGVIATLLGTGFGGKVAQKFAEGKSTSVTVAENDNESNSIK